MTDKTVGEPPEWLDEGGRRIWLALVELLGEKLIPADRFALALTCGSYAAAEAAIRDLNERGPLVPGRGKHGEEAPVKNPANQVAREQAAAFKQWCGEFGLTPRARKQLAMNLDQPDNEDDLIN